MRRARLAATLTGLTLCASPVLAMGSAADAAGYPVGPDVSGWQHGATHLGWSTAKAAGRSFASVKATESTTYTNPYFAGDRADLHSTGLLAGSYHFARPALPISTAVAQAKHYVAVTGTPRAGDLPPVLDLETSGGLSAGDLVTWTQTFLDQVHALTGRTAIVYTYPAFWDSAMAGSTAFHRFPLWIASYTTASAPRMVGGWPTWTFWQYSDSASVPGIGGGVDESRFNTGTGSLAALADGRSDGWGLAAPSAPVSVRASNTGTTATVRWVPGSDGGAVADRYTVRASTGQSASVAGSSTSAVLSGLPSGRSVTFTVTPRNAKGTGATSPASAAILTLAPTALTTSVSSSTVAYGASSGVTGWLRSGSKALAGRSVTVWTRPAGSSTWTRKATRTTASDGTVRYTLKPSRTTAVKLAYAGSSDQRAATATRTIAVRPSVTGALSTSTVTLGRTVTLAGSVAPGLAGATVYRQGWYGGAWHTWSSQRLSATSTFSFAVKPTVQAVNRYRVYLPAASSHASAASKTVTLSVA